MDPWLGITCLRDDVPKNFSSITVAHLNTSPADKLQMLDSTVCCPTISMFCNLDSITPDHSSTRR